MSVEYILKVVDGREAGTLSETPELTPAEPGAALTAEETAALKKLAHNILNQFPPPA